jgi:hypothetical protein
MIELQRRTAEVETVTYIMFTAFHCKACKADRYELTCQILELYPRNIWGGKYYLVATQTYSDYSAVQTFIVQRSQVGPLRWRMRTRTSLFDSHRAINDHWDSRLMRSTYLSHLKCYFP